MIESLERRVLLTDNRPYGIDVSHWDGTINWSQVFAAQKVFAWQKATEGVTYNDPTLATNMSGAHNAGVLIGAYHFARPENNTAAAEATHFINQAKQYMTYGYLRPALDLESGADVYTTAAFTQWVIDFETAVFNSTGLTPVIYIGRYAREGEVDSRITVYPMWVAHWTFDPINTQPNTGIWPTYAFWQYADNGTVPGISGTCDLDVFNGTTAQLQSTYAIPRTAVTASSFLYQTGPQKLTFTFNLNVSASLSTQDLVLTNTTTGQQIPAANMALSYNNATNVATFTFPNYPFAALPDGQYTARLIGSGVKDLAGTTLAGDFATDFFVLAGDANHDRIVNLSDFNILASNFGQPNRTFGQGDFNYDTVVGLGDFNILASKFGTTVSPQMFGRTIRIGGAFGRDSLVDEVLA